jgi:predicted amidophosphoribosyltransferase
LIDPERAGGFGEGCRFCYDRYIYYDSLSFVYCGQAPIRHGMAQLKFLGYSYILDYIHPPLKEYGRQGLAQAFSAFVPVPTSSVRRGKTRQPPHLARLFAPLAAFLPKFEPFVKGRSLKVHQQGRENRFLLMPYLYQLKPRFRGKIAHGDFLLVDDFVTSGATVNYLAYLLKVAGARSVAVLALHRNLPHQVVARP